MKNFKDAQIDNKELQNIKGGRYPISEADCRRFGGYWDRRRRFCILY